MSRIPDARDYATLNPPLHQKRNDARVMVIATNYPAILEKAACVAFARKIARVIQDNGFSEAEAWQIIRASGPGMALRALELGNLLQHQTRRRPGRLNQFVSVVGTFPRPWRRKYRFSDWLKWEERVKRLHLKFPLFNSPREFFQVLKGARKVLQLRLSSCC